MSEEILKALMELFALVVKQDGGILKNEREYVTHFLKKQLTRESVDEYLLLFDEHAGPVMERDPEKKASAPSVRDSVKILTICKKINRTLNQEQKVVVVMRLFELINADRQYTHQRMNIINTVAEVFRISSDEFEAIEQFVKNNEPGNLRNTSILVLDSNNKNDLSSKIHSGYPDTVIVILRIASVDLYFLKYSSGDQLYLNGLPISSGSIYTLAKGSSLKSAHGNAIYYSDLSYFFQSERKFNGLSFIAENLSFSFREGHTAVHDISFSAGEGKLIGIMGASGSGKTTLLNLLSGIQKPQTGSVRVNGFDIFTQNDKLEGLFGFVPQDDLLIEDLTVYENLFFAASQCFREKTRKELTAIVDHTLASLGLLEKRDFKVGSPLNKVISGGQRKRLNIALELIREPLILFVDEPTSGLSSRDSENLMDLFRELTLKGKLIFTVIHQPSSEIFKMFDKVLILDQGGYMAYFGNPVDSVIYFKTIDSQINSNVGECPSCGNVNPETIFNIIETQVVDEFGKYTEQRKVKPEEWAASFCARHPFKPDEEINQAPRNNLERPGVFGQFLIYLKRDFKGKLANRQYVMLTLLEAPVLGFVLSAIIRYIPDPGSDVYIFADNENIPIYIFMSLIVALFLGLTISAEEIFRDRKILKRERFLNLSRSGYLLSKIALLVFISALQTFLFLIIANPVLGIKGMFMHYWISLFTTAFCANMLGLNISASFNSAITIYIVIPLLIIPMMVLSGAMFPFDKLNRSIGNVQKVPLIAEVMPTRWTYEALIVSQFKDNKYNQLQYDREGDSYYNLQKKISQANFDMVHRIPALEEANRISLQEYKSSAVIYSRLALLRNEIGRFPERGMPAFTYIKGLEAEEFGPAAADSVRSYLEKIDSLSARILNEANDRIDRFWNMHSAKLKRLENEYYNYSLKEIVTKPYERRKILTYNNTLVQNTDPVYLEPHYEGILSFRAHFFSPSKYIFGIKVDTFTFNICLVLLSTVILYFTLYHELGGKLVRFFENLRFRK